MNDAEKYYIVYLYVKGNMVNHAKFKTMNDANEYAKTKRTLGYKALVVDKNK